MSCTVFEAGAAMNPGLAEVKCLIEDLKRSLFGSWEVGFCGYPGGSSVFRSGDQMPASGCRLMHSVSFTDVLK